MTHELQPSDIKEEDIRPMLASVRNDLNREVRRINTRADNLEHELIVFAEENREAHARFDHQDTSLKGAVEKLTEAVERLSLVLAPIIKNRQDTEGFWAIVNKYWLHVTMITGGSIGFLTWFWLTFKEGIKAWLRNALN